MAKVSPKLKKWRKRQKRGAIMKPSTFAEIVNKCLSDHPSWSSARCKRVAGKAYWKTAKSKFAKRRKK